MHNGTTLNTHLAFIHSNIVGFGFPIYNGSLPSAVFTGDRTAPAPGNNPYADGYVLSPFVARNWHSGSRRRYWKALERLV